MKKTLIDKKIKLIAKAAFDKKALDLVVIDLRKFPTACEYFVVISGESTTQIDSIANHIEWSLRKHGYRSFHREGKKEALWILLDSGNVVTHVFHKPTRVFYNLEKLWYDAPQKKITEKQLNKRAPSAKKKTKSRRAIKR